MSPSVMELGAGGVGESQDALRIKSAVPTNVSQVETSSVALRLAAAFGQPSSTMPETVRVRTLPQRYHKAISATGLDFQSKCGNSRGEDRFQHESFPVVNLSTEQYGDAFDWVDIVLYILHEKQKFPTEPEVRGPRLRRGGRDAGLAKNWGRCGLARREAGRTKRAHAGGESRVLGSDEERIARAHRKNLKREHGCICAECGVQSTARTSRDWRRLGRRGKELGSTRDQERGKSRFENWLSELGNPGGFG
ncbi:hypothetical protein B0H13DRAFT_1928949 [Mycena leptocephala]|nr:hypothetical protein B0H13DRAFT_1928949 [Mycena leptocephala]